MHNKELHDHGELDDVDPDDDSRFDIIYSHLDPNLGIEMGESQSFNSYENHTEVLTLSQQPLGL